MFAKYVLCLMLFFVSSCSSQAEIRNNVEKYIDANQEYLNKKNKLDMKITITSIQKDPTRESEVLDMNDSGDLVGRIGQKNNELFCYYNSDRNIRTVHLNNHVVVDAYINSKGIVVGLLFSKPNIYNIFVLEKGEQNYAVIHSMEASSASINSVNDMMIAGGYCIEEQAIQPLFLNYNGDVVDVGFSRGTINVMNENLDIGGKITNNGRERLFFKAWKGKIIILPIGSNPLTHIRGIDGYRNLLVSTFIHGAPQSLIWNEEEGVNKINILDAKVILAKAINEKYMVVGNVSINDEMQGYVWNVERRDSIIIPNKISINCTSINGHGDVIGWDAGEGAFYWNMDYGVIFLTEYIDKNSVFEAIKYPRFINNKRQVSGIGITKNGIKSVFIATISSEKKEARDSGTVEDAR